MVQLLLNTAFQNEPGTIDLLVYLFMHSFITCNYNVNTAFQTEPGTTDLLKCIYLFIHLSNHSDIKTQ